MKVKLTDIIDSILLDAEDTDSYIHNVRREEVIKHCIRSLEEIHYAGDKVIKEAEGEMNNVGKFRMPADFVDYIRVFFIVDGYLIPALQNPNINTWYSYLLTNDDIRASQTIKTDEGEIIQDNKDYDIVHGEDLHGMKSVECMLKLRGNEYLYGKHGYKFDHRDNTLTFDDVPEGYHRILIQYVANLNFDEIDKVDVHPYFQKAIETDVYYRLIASKRNVPSYEKERARRDKNRKYRDAMFELNFKVGEVKQALFGL